MKNLKNHEYLVEIFISSPLFFQAYTEKINSWKITE